MLSTAMHLLNMIGADQLHIGSHEFTLSEWQMSMASVNYVCRSAAARSSIKLHLVVKQFIHSHSHARRVGSTDSR